jgi:hypothetical protein
MSNKKVKQMICDQLVDLDNSILIKAWFENGKLRGVFGFPWGRSTAFVKHGRVSPLTANQLKGISNG